MFFVFLKKSLEHLPMVSFFPWPVSVLLIPGGPAPARHSVHSDGTSLALSVVDDWIE